ncbi:fibrillarin-like rRNA/tRNA 2'-O-methyltransferase [Candidatus Woesearchaeota archaeon]|nr:fibrillarin-like rRNA/tRNA 2'-O-methyltransferase [Candidatus Woesearchaeota archaeon]
MKQGRFKGVFEQRKGRRNNILTRNLTPGKTVYDELLVREGKNEYREWNPKKSKLGAAILKGIKEIGIEENSVVLYLGAAYGTTASHVSDIVGKKGFVFALDFAPRVMRDMVFVCEERKNMAPMFFDANKPEEYKDKMVKEVDVVYMDIAQRNQTEIFLKNVDMFLRKGGYGLLALKARSVDVTAQPRKIFESVRRELEKHLKIIDFKILEPFEKDHCMFVCKKGG